MKTLYAKGKEFASKLYGHKHFVVEETPDFMKKLGLSGDRFTIRYGVISRHLDKDNSHYLSEEEWEKLPDALKAPFAITKLSDKDKAYRIYTTLRNSKGEHIVVGVDVKNAGRDLEVNSISTVFGKNTKGGLTKKETIIYEDKKITPEQKSLLSGPNFRQYPDAQELSENKGTNKSETLQEEKVKSEKGTQETPIDKINEHRAAEGLEEVSEEEVALRDALNEQLKKSGIDVVTDVEDGERVLAMADGNDVKENKVYHGSGADFDKFDHSHIGEGEGAQAFGWGTYLTEVKGIGEGYARRCFANVGAKYIGNVLAKNEAHLLEFLFVGRTYNELEDFLEGVANSNEPGARRSAHALAMLRKTKPSDWVQSSQVDRLLYTVEIPDDNGKNFLHWESQTPSETVEKIRNYVREHCSEEVAEEFDKQIAYGTDNPDLAEYGQNGENVYNALEYALHSDKKASLALSELGMQGISYPADFMRGGRKDGARNYVIFKEEDAKITDKVRFFKTKNGKAYGFTVGGKIYVDPRIAKADTPIHEYSHLWASMFRDVNPKEWKNVVKLMKDTPLWEEIRKKYPELKTDEEIADEVLAHFSGKRGAERLRQAQQEAMKEKGVSAKAAAISAIERVRKALSTFWKGVCDLLHIHFTSAEEVADRVLSDMLNGVDPVKVKKGEGNLHYRDEKEVQRVNEKFNEELQMQIDGKLPENHIYKIGKPGSVLRSTGVPDLPIQMSARRLQEKATLFDHNFDLRDVKDLVQALQDPLAIFAYGDKTKAQNIIIPLQKGGKNFIVGLSLRPIVNGSHLEINSIRNVFPKDNSEWLNWISQGKALYLNKEKIQILIDQQRTNLADVDYLDLDSMAKVIENFENPKNVDEKLKYRTSSEIDAEYPSTSATDPESKTNRATEISEHLNTPVRVITSEKEMEGLSPRQKKAKGWYNTATGEVVVVVPNNVDVADVENTVLHEVIGHDGIRVLFPDEKKLNNALDEMYRVSNKGIKDKIDAETQKMYDAEVSRIMDRKRKEHEAKGEDANATYYTDMAEAHKEASAKREQMRRDATEEYGADLAGRIGEEGFEKMTAEEKTFWGKIKSVLQEALKRLLDGLGIKSLKKWGDKEWAYIYHEAYKRKKNGGNPTVLDLAESAAMREKTGFGKDEENGKKNIKFRNGGDDLNSIIENVKANAEQFNAESKERLHHQGASARLGCK